MGLSDDSCEVYLCGPLKARGEGLTSLRDGEEGLKGMYSNVHLTLHTAGCVNLLSWLCKGMEK